MANNAVMVHHDVGDDYFSDVRMLACRIIQSVRVRLSFPRLNCSQNAEASSTTWYVIDLQWSNDIDNIPDLAVQTKRAIALRCPRQKQMSRTHRYLLRYSLVYFFLGSANRKIP